MFPHVLAHFFGLDSASGTAYLAWSGVLSDLGEIVLIGGMVGLYKKHACHVKGCWRIARHPVPGTAWIVCRRHTVGGEPTHRDVIDAHAAAVRRHSGEACERIHQSAPKEGP